MSNSFQHIRTSNISYTLKSKAHMDGIAAIQIVFNMLDD